MVEPAIRSIVHTARTGEDGDGKIYVFPILEAYNIRTGEADTDIDDLMDRGG
jgi:nitrogen regulatory protein P-II 1